MPPRKKTHTPWWSRWKEFASAIVVIGAAGTLLIGAIGWAARASEALGKVEQHERDIKTIREQTAEIGKDRAERRRVLEALCATGEVPAGVCIAEGIPPGPSQPEPSR